MGWVVTEGRQFCQGLFKGVVHSNHYNYSSFSSQPVTTSLCIHKTLARRETTRAITPIPCNQVPAISLRSIIQNLHELIPVAIVSLVDYGYLVKTIINIFDNELQQKCMIYTCV